MFTTSCSARSREADFAFHFAIAKASNNRYYMQALTAIEDHVSIGMKVGGARLIGPEPSLSDVVSEHEAVFEAIRDRNAETARTAMQRHIAASRARVFQGQASGLVSLGARSRFWPG